MDHSALGKYIAEIIINPDIINIGCIALVNNGVKNLFPFVYKDVNTGSVDIEWYFRIGCIIVY